MNKNLVTKQSVYGTESYYIPESLSAIADGDSRTVWALSSREAATGLKPVWVTADLGCVHVISRYVVKMAGAAGMDAALNLCDFELQTSNDGVTFRSIQSLSGNAANVIDLDCALYARYFRIWITKATNCGGDGVARLSGLELYGTPAPEDRVFNSGGVFLRQPPKPSNRIVETVNPTADLVFATYVATDEPYDMDNTGEGDVTAALQRALDDCGLLGGGVVFLPAGRYRITGSITLPSHVTLRGDWKDPDTMAPGESDYGTMILADVESSQEEFPGLFRMTGSTGIKNLTIYYPSQSIDDVRPYPWTIELPGTAMDDGAWMAQTVKDVTLLNSYLGIAASLTNNTARGNHEIHYLNNIRISALKKGMHIQNCSDTGRTRDVTVANRFWANAGAGMNAPDAKKMLEYTLANTIGLAYGDSEWENMYNVRVSDMNIGFLVTKGPRTGVIGSLMLVFDTHVDNCVTALKVEAVDARCGTQFANSSFRTVNGRADSIALHITENRTGSSLYNNCTFDAGGGRLVYNEDSHYANFQNCHFGSFGSAYGIECRNDGRLIIEGCDFSQIAAANRVAVKADPTSRALVVNAVKFDDPEEFFLVNEARGSAVDFSGWDTFKRTPVKGHLKYTGGTKPAGTHLIIATEPPYNAPVNGADDAAPAIQRAMEDMGALGGGVVYLPAGHYRMHEPVVVPEGVELRGADGSHHRAESRGTTFFVTGGRDTKTPDSDPAAVTLKSGAGLRGVNFCYPLIPTESYDDYFAYPWSVRGDGSGVYVVDVTFLNAFKAIDLSGDHSAPCDNHYVSYAAGCVLHDGIRVGKSSSGWLEDCNWNPNYWNRTDLPNRYQRGPYWRTGASKYIANNMTMLALGACENENILNYAFYAAQTAYRMYEQDGKGPNATLINVPADGVSGNIIVEATGDKGVNITNTVLCVLAATKPTNDGIEVRGGKLGVYNMLALGMVDNNIRINGGSSVFQGACFFQKTLLALKGTSTLSGIILKMDLEDGAIYDRDKIAMLSDIRKVVCEAEYETNKQSFDVHTQYSIYSNIEGYV